MKLSKNLTLKEAIKSYTAIKKGIDNTPSDEEIKKLKVTANHVFQPIRGHFNVPIGITSMYRSPRLNKAIGGASSSQHMKCEAIDIDADIYDSVIGLDEDGNKIYLTNRKIYEFIRDNLEFDQLIWEFGTDDEPAWIHVSYKKENNRKRILRATRGSDHRVYYSSYF